MLKRVERLILTFIAKKYVAWCVASAFLWFAKISGSEWVLLTGAIFTLDLVTKVKCPVKEVPDAGTTVAE